MENPQRVGSESPRRLVHSARSTSTENSAETAGARSTRQQPGEVMDWLHQTLTDAMSTAWTSKYTRKALDTWAKGLHDMTVEQIKRGVWNLIDSKTPFAPTLQEFRALCLTVPGMPSKDEAWAEAHAIACGWKKPHECSHKAIWHAYVNSGDLAHTDTEIGRKRFERNYEITCRAMAAGKALTPIPEALPAPGEQAQRELTPDEVEQRNRKRDEALAELNRMFPSSSRAHAFGAGGQP